MGVPQIHAAKGALEHGSAFATATDLVPPDSNELDTIADVDLAINYSDELLKQPTQGSEMGVRMRRVDPAAPQSPPTSLSEVVDVQEALLRHILTPGQWPPALPNDRRRFEGVTSTFLFLNSFWKDLPTCGGGRFFLTSILRSERHT